MLYLLYSHLFEYDYLYVVSYSSSCNHYVGLFTLLIVTHFRTQIVNLPYQYETYINCYLRNINHMKLL